MKITLITDSTCDISPSVLREKGVIFAPLKVLFPEREYIDKYDLTNAEFYEKMKMAESLPTTSQVNPNEFHELFSEALQKGTKVLGVFLSSELSGTYQSAVIAKEMIGSDDIFLVDARTTSFGLGLIVNKLLEFLDQGMEIPQVLDAIHEKIQNTQLYGMLDTLENLKRGGRLSSGSAMIGKMLNLKPIIETKEGIVGVASKARGSKKGMIWMLDQMEEAHPDKKLEEIGIAHANAPDKLMVFKQMILERFTVDKIYESEIGSVVGTHTGEGAVGLVYFKK